MIARLLAFDEAVEAQLIEERGEARCKRLQTLGQRLEANAPTFEFFDSRKNSKLRSSQKKSVREPSGPAPEIPGDLIPLTPATNSRPNIEW